MKRLLSICLVAMLSQGVSMGQSKDSNILPYQNTSLSPEQPTSAYAFEFKAGETYDIVLDFEQMKGNAYLNFDLVEEETTEMAALLKQLRKADVVVFAGGISPQFEGEEMSVSAEGFRGGDRTSIELPEVQRDVLKALKKAGKKVVFVNFSGSAMGLVPETELCDAILQAWYPGQEGGTAVAEALTGAYNPAGRLPVTFYRSTDQLPHFEDYSMKGRTYRYLMTDPLFPFGFGLSYTSFAYGAANLDKTELSYGETATLEVPVQNTGKVAGDEVVQVYLRRPGDAEGPMKSLRGFKRISLAKGETKECRIELPYEAFEWFDEITGTMHPMEGCYEILYGGSSREEDLQKVEIDLK